MLSKFNQTLWGIVN